MKSPKSKSRGRLRKSKSTLKSKSRSDKRSGKTKSKSRGGKTRKSKSRFGNHKSPQKSEQPWSVRCKDMKNTCKSTPTTLIGDDWCDVPEWDVFHDSTSGSCIQKSDVYAMFLASNDKIKHPISRRFFTPAEVADVFETLGRQGKLKTMTSSKYNDLLAHYGQQVAEIYQKYTVDFNVTQFDLAQFQEPSFQNIPRGVDEGGQIYNLASVLCSMLAHNLKDDNRKFKINQHLYIMIKTMFLMSAKGRNLYLWEKLMTPLDFVKICYEAMKASKETKDLLKDMDSVSMLDTAEVYTLTPDFHLKHGVNLQPQSFGTLANIVSTYREKYATKNLAFWNVMIKKLKEFEQS